MDLNFSCTNCEEDITIYSTGEFLPHEPVFCPHCGTENYPIDPSDEEEDDYG